MSDEKKTNAEPVQSRRYHALPRDFAVTARAFLGGIIDGPFDPADPRIFKLAELIAKCANDHAEGQRPETATPLKKGDLVRHKYGHRRGVVQWVRTEVRVIRENGEGMNWDVSDVDLVYAFDPSLDEKGTEGR